MFQRLQVWYNAQAELKAARDREAAERRALSGYFFTDPAEGTNRLDIGGGYDLVMKRGISRSVDEAALENVTASKAKKLKLNLDELFPTKPVLNVTAYRELTDEQRLFVDSLLTIKDDGLPGLSIQQRAEPAPVVPAVPVAPTAPPPPPTIVENAEDAEPGNYYTDGERNWWQLNADNEWDEVSTPSAVDVLEAFRAGEYEDMPPAPPAPKKGRGRRKKAS
jgi:hypothetical protein